MYGLRQCGQYYFPAYEIYATNMSCRVQVRPIKGRCPATPMAIYSVAFGNGKASATHGEISAVFRNGNNSGRFLQELSDHLMSRRVKPLDIKPLVVVKLWCEFWVVLGNGRLKALKHFSTTTAQEAFAACGAHGLDTISAPPAILARFITSSTKGCLVWGRAGMVTSMMLALEASMSAA